MARPFARPLVGGPNQRLQRRISTEGPDPDRRTDHFASHADGCSLVSLVNEFRELGFRDHNPRQHAPPRLVSNRVLQSTPSAPENFPIRGQFYLSSGVSFNCRRTPRRVRACRSRLRTSEGRPAACLQRVTFPAAFSRPMPSGNTPHESSCSSFPHISFFILLYSDATSGTSQNVSAAIPFFPLSNRI